MTDIEIKNETLFARVSGDIDHHYAKSIREALDREISLAAPRAVVLDLAGVSFMDSSGLGLVLGRYNLCRDAEIDFRVVGADERTLRIFEMAGLSRIVKIDV